jgi:hypothetical protein
VDEVEAAFVGQNLVPRLLPQPGQARVVAARQRLLDERQVAISQLLEAVGRLFLVPAAVRIDHQGDIRPDGPPHGPHAGHVAQRLNARLYLDGRKALRN